MTHADAPVTNAELRQAMEKLSAAFIKSTAKTGEVLFGNSQTGSLGMIGSEMKMGFSSADMTQSALNAQADGMICAGVFSIVAGCAAIGGAEAEAGAIGGEMSASAEIDALPTVEEGAEPATQATTDLTPADETATGPETSGDGTPLKTQAELREMEEAGTVPKPGEEVEMRDMSSPREETEVRLQERTEAREEESRVEDNREDTAATTNQEQATVEVQNSERGMTAEQKTAAKEKTSKQAQAKIAKARGFQQAGMAIPQAMGSLGQAQYKQDEATQQSGAQVRQTEQQAINTSSQVAQKFYGDLQQGVTAAGQTVDLINQTVVASSRI